MERRTIFPGKLLPMLLIAPQLALTFVFFLWPAARAVGEAVTATNAFGTSTIFVGIDNFTALFADSQYWSSVWRTLVFCASVSLIAMVLGMLFANFTDRNLRGKNWYRTFLIWPYAVAPALSAVVWVFMADPQIGVIGRYLGPNWNYGLNGAQAMGLVIAACAWKQVSYNFIFYLAALQAIPRSLVEAATLDGARGLTRFRTIVWPLLWPTTMFLLVVNLVYAAFDTFGAIYALTGGGPAGATETLVVKVYEDGYIGNDIGGSAAQSVALMVLVVALVSLQFRFLNRRVQS
ncbi:MAG: ABC transporter permease subunit [Acidocella sp.]|nr:ABC transporter permease subunit [Acidocella sp.]